MLLSLPLLFALCVDFIVGDKIGIHNADELIEFSDNVNNGTTYKGTTVFLDFDIDLNGVPFEPIGNNGNFLGTFDGQGYTISNLAMNSFSQYVGLFGYLSGSTIINTVLDSSCSIESVHNSSKAYIGGIIGYSTTENEHCTIKNNVNMASITFTGNVSKNSLYVGGIVGYTESTSSYHGVYVKNCVNYGIITHSGPSLYYILEVLLD